jgi:adenylate cyclase
VAEPVERRLAAILSADAVGYSRLMSRDDEATVRELDAHRRSIERSINSYRGRLVDAPGDNLLAEFPSVVGAVRCAVEVQRAVAAANETLKREARMQFRIGVHLGDVIFEGARIYGSGVNIAARLEALATPGNVCLSDFVYQQVRGKLDVASRDLGEKQLKNIVDPIRVHEILLAEGPAAPITGRREGLPLPDSPSLAVLPFFDMGGDPAQQYFSDGLSRDIMTELTRIPGLFVIAGDATFAYQRSGAKPAEVARELGVRHVLEGAVRREERRVRTNARLLDGSNGRIVWSERFDRELEDVFAVQDEIVQEVVTALDVALVGGSGAIETRKHLRNPQALGILYRGADLMHRFNREDMREARRLFEEVMRLEPASPIAYMDAAWTYYFEVQRGWSADPEASLREMSRLAQRGFELGDVSGFASLMLSHMHLMRREHDAAMALSERALAERPSCQGAFGLRANILNFSGLPEEAMPLALQAIRLSPLAQTFYPEVLAHAYYLCGRLEEAIEAAHRTLRLAPDSVDARVLLVVCLVETGRLEAARNAATELLAVDPAFRIRRFARCQPYRDPLVLTRLAGSLREAGIAEGDGAPVAGSELAPPSTPSRRRIAPRPRH